MILALKPTPVAPSPERAEGETLHPMVAGIVEGLSYARVLERLGNRKLSPLEEAVKALQEVRSNDDMRCGLDLARKVRLEGFDANLVIVFLVQWSHTAAQFPELQEEHRAAWTRAKSLVGAQTPKELAAMVAAVEGIYETDRTGNHDRTYELFGEILRTLGRQSPRYGWHLIMLARLLGRHGKLARIETELDCLVESDPERYRGKIAIYRFCNAVECGRLEEAERWLEVARQDPAAHSAMNLYEYPIFGRLLKFMKDPHALDGDADCPKWARIMSLLMERRPAEALELARANEIECPWTTMKSFGSDSLGLIRSEIACGNHRAARRLLEGRRGLGNRHWVDDLFFARIERQAGNAEAAARHFAAMLHAAEFFGSQGRVDFELGMACELTPTDVGRLYREAAACRDTAAFLDAQAGDGEGQAPPPGAGAAAHLVGSSPALRGVRQAVARFAPLDATVLVTGETGTGKELVARALHEASPRRGQPFVAVNCGAIAESLLESELFGHERGAFTGAARAHAGLFEQAGRGTIFLDEIGEIAPRLQVALLRVLESGEFRPVGATRARRIACRVVAATNADLERLVSAGRFRADLLFRLQGLRIHLPPLCERREDVLPLLSHFLSAERAGRVQVAPDVADALYAYPWPGNVRELRSVADLFRILNAGGGPYGTELLELVLPKARREASGLAAAPGFAGSATVPPARAGAFAVLSGSRAPWRQLDRLRELFREHGKLNRTEAARLLGVAPKTATAYLKALCAEGAVEKRTPTPSPRSHHFVWCG